MKKLIAILLTLTLLLAGCGKEEGFPHWEDGETVGTGAQSFSLTIVDDQSQEVHVTVNTDKETVGEALQELHIIFGTMGDYGLYIETVNGLTVKYEDNGCYWAFYINGEYAQQSADLTPVEPGTEYMLKVECA